MVINYWAVIVCAVLAMVLGFIWYGPLFGKVWMRIYGADKLDEAKRKEMQKKAGPLYLVQFVLVLFQIWALATYTIALVPVGVLIYSLLLWLAFIMPTIASTCMWTNDPRRVAWTKFGIQSGYQLLLFIMFGLILGLWQ